MVKTPYIRRSSHFTRALHNPPVRSFDNGSCKNLSDVLKLGSTVDSPAKARMRGRHGGQPF